MRGLLWMLMAVFAAAVAAGETGADPALSVAQIVENNVAARGGLEAWRKIQTMVWIGHIEHASAASLPYVLEQKRPNKTRFEIKSQNQVGVRIYDGTHGWKLRPASNGRPEVQPYSAEELEFARDGQGIDGPLVDYQAKGLGVTLDGIDEVEGRKAYRLSVRLPSGASHHVWLDAQTFLEVKYDRQSHNALGQTGTVSVMYRNYQAVDGLQIPLVIESGSDLAKATDKMVIDKISLNLPLEDQVFAKPNVPLGHNAVRPDSGPARALRSTLPQSNTLPGTSSRHLPSYTGTQ